MVTDYIRKRDVVRLVLTSFIEPFMYIILAWFSVKGNIQHIFKKGGWGTIKRNGNK